MGSFFLYLITGLILSLLVMTAVWAVSLKIGKASIVDPVWAGLIALLAVYYATMLPGSGLRHFVVTAMAVFWGLRLSFFLLFNRVIGKGEDPRYQELLNKWGDQRKRKMLEFFLIQGVVASVFSIPFLTVALNPKGGLSGIEIFGVLLWLIAFAGESAADLQLEAFKKDPGSKGKSCRAGLWGYSRHPNYFFEFLIWCSFFLFALGSAGGLFSVICPALIFYFLFNVTGIPKAEEQALRSRGDDYRDYQKKVSKFFPWVPKTERPSAS